MDEDSPKHGKPSEEKWDHRATNVVYKRAIIHAIEELQDVNLRSNIDAIRRHVQASFGPEHSWNDTIFLKTMKSLSNDGDIERCASVNCGLSPEFMRRRTHRCQAVMEQRSKVNNGMRPGLPDLASPSKDHHPHHEKDVPAKKPEHYKLKIIPKKIYEGLHVPVKHPMDTQQA